MKTVGINKETLDFFKEIESNNNKAWFEANKKRWEAVKENYASFMEALQARIQEIDSIVFKEPQKYVSRINRDFRFTKDKSPYRNNIWSLIERDENEKKSRFYIQIQPNDSFVAAGLWSPDNDTLKKVRQEIDYNSSEFHQIINKPSLKDYFGAVGGEALARPPKGYDAANPNIELLKLKQYIAKRNFSDEVVLSANFIDDVVLAYQEALPLLKFLDSAIE